MRHVSTKGKNKPHFRHRKWQVLHLSRNHTCCAYRTNISSTYIYSTTELENARAAKIWWNIQRECECKRSAAKHTTHMLLWEHKNGFKRCARGTNMHVLEHLKSSRKWIFYSFQVCIVFESDQSAHKCLKWSRIALWANLILFKASWFFIVRGVQKGAPDIWMHSWSYWCQLNKTNHTCDLLTFTILPSRCECSKQDGRHGLHKQRFSETKRSALFCCAFFRKCSASQTLAFNSRYASWTPSDE